MQRIVMAERPLWRKQADELGFRFHSLEGVPYWDESVHYRFTLAQVEKDIEQPSEALHELCMDLVERAIRDEQYLRRLGIPEAFWEYVRGSYLRGDPHIYGRMDFAYDGRGPAKLYELNYDTPTSLYEAAVFQWLWLEQCIALAWLPADSDQFNSLQEKLLLVFATLAPGIRHRMHFTCVRDSQEDRATVDYLADLAHQCGITTHHVAIEDIGRSASGRYTDCEDRIIEAIFKLYPWEDLFAEDFSRYLPLAGANWFEPSWKSVLSNKGALALLWELHPGHPNLLPTFFEDAPETPIPPGWVRKPLLSREGANIEIVTPAAEHVRTAGPYGGARCVRQSFHPLPDFEGHYPLIGSWIIGDQSAGIGVRESEGLITRDTARFVPHAVTE